MHNHNHSSGLRLKGTIDVETRDARTGRRLENECGTVDNVILTVGLPEFARIFAGATFSLGYEIAVGDDSTAEDPAHEGLLNETYRATVTHLSASGGSLIAKLFIDTNNANGTTLREAGLFHDLVALDRGLITPIDKTPSKTVTVSVTIDLTGAV